MEAMAGGWQGSRWGMAMAEFAIGERLCGSCVHREGECVGILGDVGGSRLRCDGSIGVMLGRRFRVGTGAGGNRESGD
jgi:hypothetical protein